MENVKNAWMRFSVYFNQLPKPVKAGIYNLACIFFANLALILLGKESIETFISTVLGAAATYMGYISNYFGAKRAENQ